jgi:carbonic anhydrase
VSDEEVGEKIYSYDEKDEFGPSNWGKFDARCDGKRQSPIALYTDALKDSKLKAANNLKIELYETVPEVIKVENNGHSVKLSFTYANGQKAKFVGGPLANTYIIDSMHWHWGKNHKGSEHTLDKIQYAAEIHVVSHNEKYGNFCF